MLTIQFILSVMYSLWCIRGHLLIIGETKNAALYGSSASVSDRGIIDRIVWAYLDSLYVTKATKMIPKHERQDANNGATKQNGHLKQK